MLAVLRGAVLDVVRLRPRVLREVTSPTQRSLALLRKEGYLAAVTEKWNAFAGIRQDLFGFIDVLAVRGPGGMRAEGETLAVQTTSASNIASRITKVMNNEHLVTVFAAGWKVEVHGWKKVKGRWTVRREKL